MSKLILTACFVFLIAVTPAYAGDIPMLPPANCTNGANTVLTWDGQTALSCAGGITTDNSGNLTATGSLTATGNVNVGDYTLSGSDVNFLHTLEDCPAGDYYVSNGAYKGITCTTPGS